MHENESAHKEGTKKVPAPTHVAIIMDGNGRWATARGRPRLEGHRAGAKKALKIVEHCGRLGVKYVTLYAFSSENWGRPVDEISGIMAILHRYLITQERELAKNEVSLSTIGDIEKLPLKIQKTLKQVEESTKKFDKVHLILALSYGSRNEITRAVRKICADVTNKTMELGEIDEQTISNYLDTRGTPDPDLWIRTSGEMRLSNFLLWQLSYAELYVTNKFWPDFSPVDLEEAFLGYAKRERRFGQ